MWESLAKALAAGLSLWDHKEKNKYVEKLMDLEKERHEEINKPMEDRDNSAIDRLDFELCVLCNSFSSIVGK